MNETIQVLMNRKSVRVFEDKEITPEIKDIILAAAMRAPTGGNCMPYSIIDVTDQSIKDKLAETCDHQPFIAQAKMVLIFCADYHRWYRKFKMAGCEDIPAPELSNMVLCNGRCRHRRTHSLHRRGKPRHRFLLYRRYCGELRDS